MQNNKSLRQNAENFLLYKRSLGYIYNTQEFYLMNFIRFAEKTFPGINTTSKETIEGYLNSLSASAGSLYNATAVLREFGKHLTHRSQTDAYIIPVKNNPMLVPEPPYFFMEEEIRRFFEAIDSVESHLSYPGRELVIPALYRLLYCCGLRCKEARTLKYEAVHLSERYLDVMQSKGPKSRRIYISEELSMYLENYDSAIKTVFPERKYFLPHKRDTCYESIFVSNNFRRFWKKAFPDFQLTTRPRAYDLRHHFVWANLNRWASEGLDLNAMLPYLARYMGHQHIRSTLYYYRFVSDFFPVFVDMAKSSESLLPEVPDE